MLLGRTLVVLLGRMLVVLLARVLVVLLELGETARGATPPGVEYTDRAKFPPHFEPSFAPHGVLHWESAIFLEVLGALAEQ